MTHIEPKASLAPAVEGAVDGAVRALLDVCFGGNAAGEDVLAELLSRAGRVLGASSGAACLLDEHRPRDAFDLDDAGAVHPRPEPPAAPPPLMQRAIDRAGVLRDEHAGGAAIAAPLADTTGRVLGAIELHRRRPFDVVDETRLGALAGVASLAMRNAQLRSEIDRAHLDVIFRLAAAAEFRDNETGGHIQRVSMYAETIATRLGLPRDECRRLLFAAPMHDVGKLGVPDAILLKPGRFTDEERRQMQRHTLFGARIIGDESPSPILAIAHEIALGHHERWDGQGYPNGLAAEAIPLPARIVAVADVFDALTSARVYKPAHPIADAFDAIERDAGVHFDPDVARAFLDARATVQSIHSAYAELDDAAPEDGP